MPNVGPYMHNIPWALKGTLARDMHIQAIVQKLTILGIPMLHLSHHWYPLLPREASVQSTSDHTETCGARRHPIDHEAECLAWSGHNASTVSSRVWSMNQSRSSRIAGMGVATMRIQGNRGLGRSRRISYHYLYNFPQRFDRHSCDACFRAILPRWALRGAITPSSSCHQGSLSVMLDHQDNKPTNIRMDIK